MNIEAHIRAEYEAAFADLPDTALPIETYAAGYQHGMRDGQLIMESVVELAKERAEEQGFKRGEAQGIAYAAYAASHTSTVDIHAGMTPGEAATKMRDGITAALQVASKLAAARASIRQ